MNVTEDNLEKNCEDQEEVPRVEEGNQFIMLGRVLLFLVLAAILVFLLPWYFNGRDNRRHDTMDYDYDYYDYEDGEL